MSVPAYDPGEFLTKVAAARERAQTVLEAERILDLPLRVDHSYDDKYTLAEQLTNSVVHSQFLLLSHLGVSEGHLARMRQWAAEGKSVTLRFAARETCEFLRHVRREEEDKTRHERSYLGLGSLLKKTEKTIHIINEWFWDFEGRYALTAFPGNELDASLELQARMGQFEVVTTSEETPRPKSVARDPLDLNITWLLKVGEFRIARDEERCRTPRRNAQVDGALQYLRECYSWASRVEDYFVHTLFPVQTKHGLDLSQLNDDDVFVPVLPLFEKRDAAADGVTLGAEDFARLESEQQRTLTVALARVARVFPSQGLLSVGEDVDLTESVELHLEVDASVSFGKQLTKQTSTTLVQKKGSRALVTSAEASLIVIMLQLKRLAHLHDSGVNHIENLLRIQLVAAIGKEVSAVDFQSYMVYHNRKIFRAAYEPRPFAYAVRRANRDPEGIVSIEAHLDDGSIAQPIRTIVRSRTNGAAMHFALDASTQVHFSGERHLHAYVSQQFSNATGVKLNLVARARQFSSFILMVGKIGGADLFQPSAAIIIKDQDELTLPLLLETLPSAKEFKEKISSLSPEQQRFSKAYRAMQLAGTLFAVCVLQIKPQMERLLNLPSGSLTQEVRLTQDLQELFIKYQIPSDLMVYEGPADTPKPAKVQAVKEHVKAIQDMLLGKKQEEIAEVEQQKDFYVADVSSLSDLSSSVISESENPSEEFLADYGGDLECKELECEEEDDGDDALPSMMLSDVDMCMELAAPAPPPMLSSLAPSRMSSAPVQSMSFASNASSLTPTRAKSKGRKVVEKKKKMAPQKQARQDKARPQKKMSKKDGKQEEVVEDQSSLSAAVLKVPKDQPKPAAQKPAAKKPTAKKPDQTQQQQREEPSDGEGDVDEGSLELEDYTLIPKALDAKFLALDTDSALRPTTISLDETWTKVTSTALLADTHTVTLDTEAQTQAKNAAFDLLDALSRSGELPFVHSSLHVVLAATHCFDRSLMDTLVMDNVNPIEKLERSSLLVGTTIHKVEDPALLIKDVSLPAVQAANQHLFLGE